MIPHIILLIGSYIIFRSIEAMLRSQEQFAGDTARAFTVLAAISCIIVAGLIMNSTMEANDRLVEKMHSVERMFPGLGL